jgi:uncharacterized protein (PEP-CTERM system associated)
MATMAAMDAREGLNRSFDKLRTNGNSLVSFVVSLPNHLPTKAEGPIQSFACNHAPCARRPRDSRAPLAGAFSVLAALAFTLPAHAVDWLFEPRVSAFTTFTDNVDQSSSNEESAFILGATPGFTLRTRGSRRMEATIDYSLTGVVRSAGNDNSDLFHNLNAAGTAELAEDFFFIDAGARVSQELISVLGSQADAVVNDSNLTTTGSFNISPYIRQRFSTFADLEARYTLYGSLFDEDVATNLLTNQFDLALDSGTRFNDLSWGLGYTYRDVSARDTNTLSDSYVYQRGDLTLGYALTRKFRLIGNLGQERLDFEVLNENDFDDSIWSAGFIWNPSRRTSIEASAGQRFYGDTYSLLGRYRTRASAWTASYVEDISDISRTQLREANLYLFLCPGADPTDPAQFVFSPFPVSPAPGCLFLGVQPSLIPSIAEGLYVSKTFRAGVNWGVKKVTYSIDASDVRRIYLLQDNAEDRSQNISATVNYRMNPLTSMFGNVGLSWTEDAGTLSGLGFDREDELFSFTLGLNRQFAADLTGSLTFRHFQRDSNDATAEYTENNITASATMRF